MVKVATLISPILIQCLMVEEAPIQDNSRAQFRLHKQWSVHIYVHKSSNVRIGASIALYDLIRVTWLHNHN